MTEEAAGYWSEVPDLMLRLYGLLRSKSSWLLGR